MMNTRELTLLSVALAVLPFALYALSPNGSVGDLGSLLGASAGFVAVIWFYRGLRLQSLQIEEQRKQFSEQHHIQYQDSLLTFLKDSSERIESALDELVKSLGLPNPNGLVGAYLGSIVHYKSALESAYPNDVMNAVQEWMKTEGPCVKFLSTVRDVVVLHKMRLGMDAGDVDQDVADYVYINSPHLLQQPLMSKYRVGVSMLSEQMMLLSPGRKSMSIAASAAAAMLAPHGIMKVDKIIEEIEAHREKGKHIPTICETLIANNAPKQAQ